MSLSKRFTTSLYASTSLAEKETWPEFFWAFAALLKAGYLPVQAIESLLETQGRRPQPQNLRQLMEHGASYEAEQDRQTFLEKAYELGSHGYPMSQALGNLQDSHQIVREHSRQRLEELTACLKVSERTGAPLALIMENLARYCEKDIDAELARQSAISAPATTGKILSWLPGLGLGLGILMGTDPLGVLFGSIPGAGLALLGGFLALAGRRWTKRLVLVAESSETD